jgi:hypothetical protein
MKTSYILGLALAATLTGSLTASDPASAASLITIPGSILSILPPPTMHHGSVCRNYDVGQANFFDFYSDGVNNTDTTSYRSVICPLEVKHTSGQTTGKVYVDAVAPTGGAKINCTLYSYSWQDAYLGSKSGTAPGWFDSVPANVYSNHSVVCSLPPNRNGKIVAIEAYF